MAKGKKKGSGPGRGRKNPPRDPKTGRLLGKTPEPTPSGSTVVSAPEAAKPAPKTAEMKPAGSTELPKEIEKDISGFRKAMTERLKELGETESGVQEAVLDGLRDTAERLVQENTDIFGKRGEKTVDQSAAYEVIEGVVALGEQAAAAKTVEQKRKILQRLKTYKSVVEKVIVGKDPRLSAISGKILEMIDNIEKPLSRESGMRAAAKEKITEFAKRVPERAAAKIPLIGGILSRSLQRRREKKEEEASALSDLTQQISRAGRSSLYGKRGEAMGAIPSIEPPISGMSAVSDIMPTPTEGVAPSASGVGFSIDNDTRKNIANILIQVKDIKEFIIDRFDPAIEETKAEEAKREEEDRLFDLARKQKDKTGKIVEGAEKKGILDSLLGLFDGGIGGMMKQLTGALSGIATTVASSLAGIALPALGVMAAAAGGAAAGYAIYKNWVEPAMEKTQAEREAVVAKKTETTRKTITTDTGEAAYSVDMMGESTVMTEREIKEKMATATPEEKEELEKALLRGPMQQIVDTESGLRADGFERFKSGETIEQFREREKADTEARKKDPGEYRFRLLKDQIVRFDEKSRIEWKKMKESGASWDALDTKVTLMQGEAEILYNNITKGGIMNKMTPEQKEKLLNLSNLVTDMGKGQIVEPGNVDNMMGIGTAFSWLQGEQSEEVKQRVQELKAGIQESVTEKPESTEESSTDSQVTTPSNLVYPDLPPLPKLPTQSSKVESSNIESSKVEEYAKMFTPVTDPDTGDILGYENQSGEIIDPLQYEQGLSDIAQSEYESPTTYGVYGDIQKTTVPALSPPSVPVSVSSNTSSLLPLPPLPSYPTSTQTTLKQSTTTNTIPPVVGKIESQQNNNTNTTTTISPEKQKIQNRINEIKSEMTNLEVAMSDPSPSNPYKTIEGSTKLRIRREELNRERQELYRELYSSEEGSLLTPPTPSTDVGRATAELEKARTAAEEASQPSQQMSPNINAVNAARTTNNAITVNNNSGTSTRNNDPTLKAAERGSL